MKEIPRIRSQSKEEFDHSMEKDGHGRAEPIVELRDGVPVWLYPDTDAEVYKDALEKEMRGHRAERYSHLNSRRFEKLVAMVRRNSRSFYVEGAPSTTIALGHMAWPQQVGEWSTASKVVFKKDDNEGRWIFDFRPLNAVTKKNLSRTVDLTHTIQELAECLWKTTLDAWAGFNQVKATERAKELMQILTVAGVLQWEVMPFGV